MDLYRQISDAPSQLQFSSFLCSFQENLARKYATLPPPIAVGGSFGEILDPSLSIIWIWKGWSDNNKSGADLEFREDEQIPSFVKIS